MDGYGVALTRKWILALLGVIVALMTQAVSAAELVFVNDLTPYCPYTLCSDGKNGYVLDILLEIYQGAGYTVTITNVPWNRALAMVNAGNVDGIVGVTREVSPDLIYPATEVARYTPAVFSLNTNSWNFAGVESLKMIRLGLVQNYGNGEANPELEKYLRTRPANVTYIAADNAVLQLIKMIEAGHIDALMEDMAVGNYLLQTLGKKERFKGVPVQSNAILGYIGFSRSGAESRRLAELFDSGMARLRKSGRLKIILANYGLSDWQK